MLSRIHRSRTRALIRAVDQASPLAAKAVKRLLKFRNMKPTAILKANPTNALQKIAKVLTGLRKVATSHPNPKVRADAKRAIKDLEATNKALNAIDGKTVKAAVEISQRLAKSVGYRGWGGYKGRAEGGPVGGGYAQGGAPDFSDAPTRKSTGGRHSRPIYLVGEENRPEFVIATNPRYRKANLGYLRMAAQALGVVPGFARGGESIEDPLRGSLSEDFGKSRKEIAKERLEKLKERLGTYKELQDTLDDHSGIGRIPGGSDAGGGWGRWMQARRGGNWGHTAR